MNPTSLADPVTITVTLPFWLVMILLGTAAGAIIGYIGICFEKFVKGNR